MTTASLSSAASHLWFRSITVERMHQFHLNFTEGPIIIKYMSRSIKGAIGKILTELWPFFDLDLG